MSVQDTQQRLLDDDVEPEVAKPKFSLRTEAWTSFQMGWPMLISFACRIAMASTDSAFVGHINNSSGVPGDPIIGGAGGNSGEERVVYSPEEYLAAASLSDMVTGILIVPPLAFNQVLNALVGQALGSGNPKMAGTWLQLSVFFVTVSYVPFLFAMYFIVADVLRLLSFDEVVCQLAGRYARWNVFWPIPNGIYQCLRFYFQAQGISRPAMWNNLAFVFVNAALNWLFVFGGPLQYVGVWHGLGFIGAAVSLSTSRCLQPLAYYLYMFSYRRAHVPTWPGWTWAFLQPSRVRRFLVQAMPLIGTLLFQSVVGQATTLMVAKLGTLAIAASAAVNAATQIASQGFAAAFTAVAAVRVGFHLGRDDAHAAKRAAALVFATSAGVSVLTLLVLWPLRHYLCGLVTSDAQTRDLAASIVAAGLVSAGVGQLVSIGTSGVLAGQGRTLVTTLLSFGFELPASIGGVAALVFLLPKAPERLLQINWAQAGISLVEVVVVGLIIGCAKWQRYADEARKRQERDREGGEEGAGAEAPGAADPLVVAPVPAQDDLQAQHGRGESAGAAS